MWDLSKYQIELRLEFFAPGNPPQLIASGRSYRTSTARADVTVMVQEIFQEIRREIQRRNQEEGSTRPES